MLGDQLPLIDGAPEVRPICRSRPFRPTRSILLITLGAVWFGLLVDPQIGPLVFHFVSAFGLGLTVMATAMGLGLLGFGIFAVGDRLAGWIRRASQWPQE